MRPGPPARNSPKPWSNCSRRASRFTKENLEATYVARRRASWVEEEGRIAEKARDGFHRGVIPGLIGMALAGFTDGKHSVGGEPGLMPSPEEYYRGQDPRRRVAAHSATTAARAAPAATTR